MWCLLTLCYLQKNSQNQYVPRNEGMCFADARPCLMKMWTSNLGFQKCNETGYLVGNNITKNIHKNSVDIQIVNSENEKRKTKSDKEMIKVRLKENTVNKIDII